MDFYRKVNSFTKRQAVFPKGIELLPEGNEKVMLQYSLFMPWRNPRHGCFLSRFLVSSYMTFFYENNIYEKNIYEKNLFVIKACL